MQDKDLKSPLQAHTIKFLTQITTLIRTPVNALRRIRYPKATSGIALLNQICSGLKVLELRDQSERRVYLFVRIESFGSILWLQLIRLMRTAHASRPLGCMLHEGMRRVGHGSHGRSGRVLVYREGPASSVPRPDCGQSYRLTTVLSPARRSASTFKRSTNA
ncbi:hypothetical protein BDV97DRAFT_346026 [Delphinella strobiligena]|nr:hypothetical protein BDV97DRAFT_346026 [Delphinella strobiligena]